MSAPIPLAFFRSSREGGASAAWQTSYNNVVSASGMSSPSPTAEGFRLIFCRPAIPFAEIAWRWSFVAAMWFLGAMFLVQYADSLTVTRLERLMLGTNQPVLVLRAIHRIFQGSAFRFTKAAVLVAIALTIAWIVLASLGRAVTVRALTDEFRIAGPHGPGRSFSSLIFLNFLRAAVTLAAAASCLGAVLLASSIWASTHVSVADAARLCFAVLFFACLAWAILNWFLTTASVFAVIDQRGSLSAITSAVRFCQERTSRVLATGTWFGLAHLGALMAAFGAGLTALTALGALRAGPVLFLEFVIAVLYFAAADFLYAGRLAAYVSIIRGEAMLDSGQPHKGLPGMPESSPVDQSELIMSDLPLPAS
jgi:hypothetical protein